MPGIYLPGYVSNISCDVNKGGNLEIEVLLLGSFHGMHRFVGVPGMGHQKGPAGVIYFKSVRPSSIV